MINIITLVGRVTKDPELKKTKTNKSVVQFTLVGDDYVNKQKVPYYFDCVAWEKNAEYFVNYARKGSLVGVIGKLTHRDYTTKDGHKARAYEVVANNIQLLSKTETKEVPEPSFFNREEVKTDDVFISSEELPFY